MRDAPAKPQRGLNLDIARKHFTPDWIEDRLREMGDLKLNQLGLHFSDDQAFRIQSDSHPEIVSTPTSPRRTYAASRPSPPACTSRSSRRSTRPDTSARSCAPTPTCNCATYRAEP